MTPVRNMLFYCCPMASQPALWRRAIRRLRRWIDQFDGVRSVVIAQGDGLEPLDVVLREFGGQRIDNLITGPNDPHLFEATHWHRLLETVKQAPGITWFGHTKGITHGPDQWAIQLWVETGLELTLSRPAEYARLLCEEHYLTAGPFMLRNPGQPWGPWCFSGTFYWFHNRIFDRAWRQPIVNRWCVETWPARVSAMGESYTVCCDDAHLLRKGHTWWKRRLREIAEWRDREWERPEPSVQRRLQNRPVLNVVTPVSRAANLPVIQHLLESRLPSFDVRWHVVADSNRTQIPAGTRCHFAGETADQGHGEGQRNHALDQIAEGLVWFCDDDNLPHAAFDRELAAAVTEHPDAAGFVFGQFDAGGRLVRAAAPENVRRGGIDMAQFVLRRDAIGELRLPVGFYASDWSLFSRVWQRHRDRIQFRPPAVFYNALADPPMAPKLQY
jgi:hypothetical protein